MAFTIQQNNPLSRNQGFGATPGLSELGNGQALARLGESPEVGETAPARSAAQGQAAQDAMLLQMRSVLTGLMNNGPGETDSISGITGVANTEKQPPNASVEMANQFMGEPAADLKGKLENYSAAGGVGKNDADFVSAILANSQGYKKQPGDAAVSKFKENLVKQGWKKVDKTQARPGDVVFFNGGQHVKLVSQPGGAQGVGAQGQGKDQKIGQDNLDWGVQEFYSRS
jgi:hypothetical protein